MNKTTERKNNENTRQYRFLFFLTKLYWILIHFWILNFLLLYYEFNTFVSTLNGEKKSWQKNPSFKLDTEKKKMKNILNGKSFLFNEKLWQKLPPPPFHRGPASVNDEYFITPAFFGGKFHSTKSLPAFFFGKLN